MWLYSSSWTWLLQKLPAVHEWHHILGIITHNYTLWIYSQSSCHQNSLFLYEELEEEMCMTCPLGIKGIRKSNCTIFGKYIQGLVQAVMWYNKKAVDILKKVAFSRGNVNQCIYMKKSMNGIVYIVLYIDDNLMIGNTGVRDEAME